MTNKIKRLVSILLVTLLFVLSVQPAFAANNKRTIDDYSVEELLTLSDSEQESLGFYVLAEVPVHIPVSNKTGSKLVSYIDGTWRVLYTYDMLRKRREESLEEIPDIEDNAPVPDDAIISVDNIERLTELIGQMKPKYRDPLRLLAMGYTNREIAKSLGLTDEVVRTRLFRGRKLLWKELSNHE